MDRDRLRRPLHATTLRQEVAGPGRPWRYVEVVDETDPPTRIYSRVRLPVKTSTGWF